MQVPVVGLTGGIAAGKSTVAEALRKQSIPVVDADQLAREVVAPGSDGLEQIVDAFGSGVLAADGSLDRARMAERIFADADARQKLNALVHPRVGQRSAEELQKLRAQKPPYIVYEAALLVENGIHRALDTLIVVTASDQSRIQRLFERNGLPEAEAVRRIQAQMPQDEKASAADYVIANDGSLEELRDATANVHAQLLKRFSGATRP